MIMKVTKSIPEKMLSIVNMFGTFCRSLYKAIRAVESLLLLDSESRGIKAEIFADLRKKVGEDSRLLWHFRVMASIHEGVVLP
jgi:hypothetical protein